MRLPSRMGTMILRSTTAIDCNSSSVALRAAMTSLVGVPRPCAKAATMAAAIKPIPVSFCFIPTASVVLASVTGARILCDMGSPIALRIFTAGMVVAGLAPAQSPLRKALEMFVAPGVPARGPAEPDAPARNWSDPNSVPSLPGRGLAQHPMLYAGEGYNLLTVVNGGKVVWTYSAGRGGEIDDVWMLTNGNILFTRQGYVEEVTPRKEVAWHYDAPAGTEVHTCQPIGLDKVMLVQNG